MVARGAKFNRVTHQFNYRAALVMTILYRISSTDGVEPDLSWDVCFSNQGVRSIFGDVMCVAPRGKMECLGTMIALG